MKQKSAQSLPNNPSAMGWSPQMIRDSLTKALFDNQNSFYCYINQIVDSIDDTKADDTSVVHNTGDETIGGVKTFEVEGAKPPIHLKSDMPYVVSDTPHKVGMRAYTEDGQMAGQFAVTYDEEYSGHFANIQARCSEDEIHTFRVSHKGPTYHITKGETKEVHNIPFDENVVHNSGAETINGDKTFYKPIVVKHLDEYYDQWSKTNIGQAYINLIYNDGTVNNGIYLICGAQDSLLMMSGKNNLLNLYPEKFTHTQSKDGQLVKNITVSYPTESGTLATQEYADEIAKNKADKSEVPTKTSQLTNDTGFIDRLVSNLANYYLKNETYSKEEITSLLSNFRNFSIKPVDSLPKVGEEQIIYLVPKKDGVSPDIKEEYLYVNGKWEIIGSTKIDLSNYLTIEQGDEKYALNTNTFSFAEVSVNTPKSLTIKDIYDSIQSQLPNQNSDVILLRITGYLSFTGFAEIRYVGAYQTSLYSFKDNKFVSNYYSSDTYIDDILNSLSSNVDVSSDQEISGTKIFNIIKASSILLNDKEVALKEDIPTDYVDLTSEQTVEAFKDFIAGIGINGIKILKDSSDRIVFYFGSTPKVKIGQLDTLFANRITPDASNTYDIGRSGVYWRDLYLSGKSYYYNSEASGSAFWNIYEDKYAQLSIGRTYNGTYQEMFNFNGASFLPNKNANGYLGSANKQWKDLYLAGNLSDGTNSISIADIANKSSLSKENLVSIIGSATTELSGLMSSTDKERLDTLVALLKNEDDNTIVDTIAEVLAIFNQYPEGADLVSTLALKADKSEIVDLTSAQEISGVKTFSTIKVKHADKDNFFQISPDSNGYNVKFSFGNSVLMMLHNGGITNYRDILPDTNGTRNLGSTSALFKNLYISGYLSDGTNSITVAQIVDKLNNINLSREQLVSTIGEATSTLSGLMSAEDKTNLDTLVSLLSAEEDENVVVDRINEILSIFNQYPEGADLVSALALKADKKDIPTDYVDLNSTQNIAGAKSFSYSITRGPKQEGQSGYVDIGAPGAGNSFDRGYITYLNAPISMVTFKPQYDNSLDLGGSNGRWRNLYLSGVLTDNTNSIAVADIANKNDIPTFKTINGESIVGEGDIKIEGGSGGETRPLKEYVEAGITEKQLEPNKYYIFDSQVASNITITLAEEDDTYLDEFMGEIKVDETAINITFPNIIRWNDNGNVTNTDGVLTLEAKNTYLFSVANSLGLITNIPNPSLAEAVYTINGSIVSWEEVANATSYDVYNGEVLLVENTTLTSVDMSAYLTDAGEYTIKVISKSNYYVDSTTTLTYYVTAPLSAPTNLVLADTGTLSWDAVENAESYEVYEAEGGTLLTTVTVNYVDLTTITTLTGTHTIKVKAINTTSPNVYTASELSESVSYTWG